VAPCGSVIGAQLYAPSEAASALLEQVTISEADELTRQLAARDGEAEFRPYTGRFAGRQRDARKRCTQSLYST
jgi:hypothetical protein